MEVHPIAGVWVEINYGFLSVGGMTFIPMRGCGLKFDIMQKLNKLLKFIPMRGCGLK